MTTLHPFGTTITDATLRQTFAPLNQWEDKYRQLILLGKKLPTLTDERKAQAREIAGCENRVWLGYEEDAEGRLHFFGDSEGRIVRGLLAVLLTAVEGKSAAELLAQDPLALFDELGLRGQLSASRSQASAPSARQCSPPPARLRFKLIPGAALDAPCPGYGLVQFCRPDRCAAPPPGNCPVDRVRRLRRDPGFTSSAAPPSPASSSEHAIPRRSQRSRSP